MNAHQRAMRLTSLLHAWPLHNTYVLMPERRTVILRDIIPGNIAEVRVELVGTERVTLWRRPLSDIRKPSAGGTIKTPKEMPVFGLGLKLTGTEPLPVQAPKKYPGLGAVKVTLSIDTESAVASLKKFGDAVRELKALIPIEHVTKKPAHRCSMGWNGQLVPGPFGAIARVCKDWCGDPKKCPEINVYEYDRSELPAADTTFALKG